MAAKHGPRRQAGGQETGAGSSTSSLSVHGAGDGRRPTRFGQPSSYSLSAMELAAHLRQLRRSGWQSWEVRARFDFGTAA
jgi:hypothetical protein